MRSEVVQYFEKLGLQKGFKQGFKQGFEQGIEQGTRESIIEGILESLELRFSVSDTQKLKPMLENVKTLQRLKKLRREALQARSLEIFRQVLLEDESRTQ